MPVLPYIDEDGRITDGEFFHLCQFCKVKFQCTKCQTYYQKLLSAKTGAYCCPYGLSSYVLTSNNNVRVIFTGIRIKGVYNKKKAPTEKEYLYNPAIDVAECASVAQEFVHFRNDNIVLKEKLEAIEDLLHEARSLNGQIRNTIDQLWEANADEENIDISSLIATLKNVHVSSFMISNRFLYFDSVLNPTLTSGDPYSAVVFKKFDKMRKLLKGYMRKSVRISICSPNQSDYKYKIYPTFETLLFILLENAIKYSPEGKQVDVLFKENGQYLDVTIKSIGPYCDENELSCICRKGFRGENAKAANKNGQGFGLNFAQKICDIHEIKMSFDSLYSHKDHGVKYGEFSVVLHFDNGMMY